MSNNTLFSCLLFYIIVLLTIGLHLSSNQMYRYTLLHCKCHYCQTVTSKTRQHICASHRSINVHRIHISKAGSDLHPVFMDAQNVIFLKVQR